MSSTTIASLLHHPGWLELERTYRAEFDKEALALGRRILLTGAGVLSEADLERRAYWRALFKIMAQPENASRRISEGVEDL